jgi:heat shock protein HslJ
MRVPAVAVAATTVLIMASACGGGVVPPSDDRATPPGGGTPAGHAGAATPPGGGTPAGGADATPTEQPDRAADPAPPIDGTRWTVDTVIIGGVAVAVPAGPPGSAWLTIDGGTFFANTGCGEVEGRVRVGDGHLRFSDVTHTIPVHCPAEFAQADLVMRELLTSEATFAVEGGQLRLDHPSGIGLRLNAGRPTSPEA